MPTVGLIVCETLELEFAHILANDNSVGSFSVLNGEKSQRFIDALERNDISANVIPHIKAYRYEPTSQFHILVRVLPLTLHKSRSLLKKTILNEALQMERYTDCLFFGYGICGTGETNISFEREIEKPIFMLNQTDNPTDDCIGCLLDGRVRYYAEQRKTAGTYYVTPGWSYHWRSMLENDTNNSGQNVITKMFSKYKRILLVKTPIMSEVEMKNNIADLIQLTKLPIETQEGTIDRLVNSWNNLKKACEIDSSP